MKLFSKTCAVSILGFLASSLPILAQTAADDQTAGSPASQAGGPAAAIIGGIGALVGLVIGLIVVIGLWKIFTKAGEPGWAAIVPIYNYIVLLKIVGRPLWFFLLLIIPFVNFIAAIIIFVDLAKSFGKGTGFAVGMLLLPFIFIPMLGFGDARYVGPAAAAGSAVPAV